MTQAMTHVMSKSLAPWDKTSHSRSHAAAETLTPDVLRHYGFNGNRNLCHLLGRVKGPTSGPGVAVITSHIFPNHTGGAGLELFGLATTDINNPRNFLRLSAQVEKAFDARRLTFVLHGNELCAYLLDPSLRGKHLNGTSLKFSDVHMRPLKFQNKERPYHRLLAAHAADCFKNAQADWQSPLSQSQSDTRVMELARFSCNEHAQDTIKRWLLAGRAVQEQVVPNAGAGAATKPERNGERVEEPELLEQSPSADAGGGAEGEEAIARSNEMMGFAKPECKGERVEEPELKLFPRADAGGGAAEDGAPNKKPHKRRNRGRGGQNRGRGGA